MFPCPGAGTGVIARSAFDCAGESVKASLTPCEGKTCIVLRLPGKIFLEEREYEWDRDRELDF